MSQAARFLGGAAWLCRAIAGQTQACCSAGYKAKRNDTKHIQANLLQSGLELTDRPRRATARGVEEVARRQPHRARHVRGAELAARVVERATRVDDARIATRELGGARASAGTQRAAPRAAAVSPAVVG